VAVASVGPYASLHLIPGNHANIPPLSFLQAGCPSCHPNNSDKALNAKQMPRKAYCIEYFKNCSLSSVNRASTHQNSQNLQKNETLLSNKQSIFS